MQFKKCMDVCVRVHRRVASEDEGLCVCVSPDSRKPRLSKCYTGFQSFKSNRNCQGETQWAVDSC